MHDHWIADRTRTIEMSGIRRVFELAKSLSNPVNLSIGQPHFNVAQPIKEAAKAAIDADHNGYTLTQGIPELREKILADLNKRFDHPDREVFITSGTMGGLLLSLFATLNPGDEVIIFDPYFVAYPHLVTLAGGTPIFVNNYPDFRVDVDRVEAAITERTKVILLATPSNPTGVVVPRETLRDLAELARRKRVLLVSDEIYRLFHFDGSASSPAEFSDEVLVVEGFGKTYGITGWRLGYAHGPKALIEQMTKLQQFTFVCAPSMAQYGGLAAWDYPTDEVVRDYRRKRDLIYEGLRDCYEIAKPDGAFYLFPKVPWGTGTEFATTAVDENLLIIPGSTFSQADTHVRISFAASDETLQKGVEILRRMAQRGPM